MPEIEDSTLPVKAVTLFSSGVSYTLREGEVAAGEATVALTFRTAQINDILKSLVLLDDGGEVRPAAYPSRDPVGRALQAFAIDVASEPSRADLLRQMRGARVRAETTGGEFHEGMVVGVETATVAVGELSTTTRETLNLLTGDGLVALPLEKVGLLRVLDPRLDAELRDALALLASGVNDARRTLTLGFAGPSARTVRVGYVSEAPLWKVSYRLVLADEAAPPLTGDAAESARSYLQGWAMVENTSDDDWNDVRLSLVSGRPVSFIQDLYQPLYVPRPVVPPDVVASPYPQTHGGDLGLPVGAAPGGGSDDAFGMLREGAASTDWMAASAEPVMAAAPAPMMMRSKARAGGGRTDSVQSAALAQSTPAQATGEGAGELFEYHVTSPVTLKRQQAALIPIVSGEIGGEKLSLYNADRDNGRHPLNAVRLTNDTELHLKGGPITIFDDGVYAGDARMEEIPPGDNRLLTYAVDLAVECERQATEYDRAQEMLTISRGVLVIERRRIGETIYTLKNKAKKPRRVLVEHPFRADLALTAPPAWAERTPDWYRFAVRVAPGATEMLTVTTERSVGQSIMLFDASIDTLSFYTSDAHHTPAALKNQLTEIIRRRARIEELERDVETREDERDAITTEQERIRANMEAVHADNALYKRYVGTLDAQETRLETLRDEILSLRERSAQAGTELRAYLDAQ